MGFKPGQCRLHLETVNKFKDWMKEALDKEKAALTKSKDNIMIRNALRPWNINLEIRYTLMQVTFKLSDLLRSCLIDVWVFLK
jgi:hypothetical protein